MDPLVQYGHKEAVKVLLEKGAKVNQENHKGIIPLHLAACKGYSETAVPAENEDKSLVSKEHQKNSLRKQNSQQTDFQLEKDLAGIADSEIVELLVQKHIEKGISIDIEDEKDLTALYTAVWFGHFEVIKVLLEYGAIIGQLDQYRTVSGKQQEILEIFTKYSFQRRETYLYRITEAATDLSNDDY